MMKKAVLLTVFGAGYVLGAKAGHARYEQIRDVFLKVKNDPHVQQTAHTAAEFAQEQGTALADKAVEKLLPDTDGDLRPHGSTVTSPFAVATP